MLRHCWHILWGQMAITLIGPATSDIRAYEKHTTVKTICSLRYPAVRSHSSVANVARMCVPAIFLNSNYGNPGKTEKKDFFLVARYVIVLPEKFFGAKSATFIFGRSLAQTRNESSQRFPSPEPLVGCGRGYRSLIPYTIQATRRLRSSIRVQAIRRLTKASDVWVFKSEQCIVDGVEFVQSLNVCGRYSCVHALQEVT